jgi:Tfp pilus assembly protein PilZ
MTKAVLPRGPEGAPADPVLARIRIPFIHRAGLVCRGQAEAAFIVDLGLAGVFVERAQLLESGEAVSIRFRLPGNELEISAECEVAWRHDAGEAPSTLPTGVGLHFVSLSAADRERLAEYLAEYCRRHTKARRFARPWPLPGGEGEEL